MRATCVLSVLLGTLLVIPDVSSYRKYGRSCKDIGCMRDEVCVIAEDPCSIYERDNCGRYPTCQKAQPGGASCASTVCGENEYCRTEDGVPRCVKKSGDIGYESAGVSYVNGQRVKIDENQDKSSNAGSNTNPYSNANAPPAPADPVGGYHHVNSATNLGYPVYPSGERPSSNSGYPSYPTSNQGNRHQNSGYPPYPTQDRMPMPGYPAQPGYPVPPNYPQQYPGHQNYPYHNYPNQNRMYTSNTAVHRRNGALAQSSSLAIVCLASFVLFAYSRS